MIPFSVIDATEIATDGLGILGATVGHQRSHCRSDASRRRCPNCRHHASAKIDDAPVLVGLWAEDIGVLRDAQRRAESRQAPLGNHDVSPPRRMEPE